ncbi:hypothetical protein [Methylobacterium oryzihabitans]|uniref:hypothetical protein n=1 Tax=Methylobacterium oryzihabitans TaxID=2499852 RepID=UPI001FEAB3C2|nr:hypothetical protein [Methylobacterium oryzihabitans]
MQGAYPRDGITLADLGRARRYFGAFGEAEQLQAIAAAGAYREQLARRPDTPPKALHGWLRQGR